MTVMSLCTLFLLEVSKKVDAELGVPSQSSYHTTRDAAPDIHKMTSYMIEERIASVTERCEQQFDNPFTKGAQKVAGGYIEKYFSRIGQEDEHDVEDNC